MDIFSLQFLYALGAIVLIDLVLAGDNAIVIALAARKLPPDMRKRAILWGTGGAIIVRTLMTGVVVWLLKVPGLMLAGGALLVWIAVKLLAPQDELDTSGHASADSFWGAMKTIVIADAVMGLDNVLAVAGAAHGSFLLVVLGLLISIPIVVWGSQMILKLIERFPLIVYLGAAVLAATAVKMMLGEPLLRPWVSAIGHWSVFAYVVVVGGVLAAGYALSRRNKVESAPASLPALKSNSEEVSSMNTRTKTSIEVSATPVVPAVPAVGAAATLRSVMIPVNGSRASQAALSQFIACTARGAVKVHLVHVTPFIHRHISRFMMPGSRTQFDRARLSAAMEPAERRLLDAGFEVETHLLRSRDLIKAVAGLADELHCERIVMGAQRQSALARLLTMSVSGRLLEQAKVPVEVVLYGETSVFARFAWPAGVGAVIAVLAID